MEDTKTIPTNRYRLSHEGKYITSIWHVSLEAARKAAEQYLRSSYQSSKVETMVIELDPYNV